MWDPIVSVPDHCLSFYFEDDSIKSEADNIFSIISTCIWENISSLKGE